MSDIYRIAPEMVMRFANRLVVRTLKRTESAQTRPHGAGKLKPRGGRYRGKLTISS
jgi:hypothetical protein